MPVLQMVLFKPTILGIFVQFDDVYYDEYKVSLF